MDHLGLGIEINMIDGVTMVAQNIVNSFNNVENAADHMATNVHDNMQQLESLMQAGEQVSSWGESLKSLGEKGAEGLFSLGEHVVDTAGEFETLRTTMNALYGSTQKGGEMFNWAVQQSMNYPVTLKQLIDIMNKFQGAGLDIQHTLKGIHGGSYMALNAITDLNKGLGLGSTTIGISRAEKAITEISDANNWREMQTGLFITKDSVQEKLNKSGFSQQAQDLNLKGGTDEDKVKRLDAIMTYVELRFGNVTQKLAMTWDTLKTNFIDIMDVFKASIASGFFPDFEKSLFAIHGILVSHRSDWEALGKAIGTGFDDIWQVISKVLFVVTDLILKFSDFSKAHPHLAGLVVDIIAIASVLAIATGSVLIFAGQAITAIATLGIFALTLQTAGEGALTFTSIMTGIGTSMLEFLPIVALVIGSAILLYEAWNTNWMGIRDTAYNVFNYLKESFGELIHLFSSMSNQNGHGFMEAWFGNANKFGWVKDVVKDFMLLEYTINSFSGKKDTNLEGNMHIAGIDDNSLKQIDTFTKNVKSFFDGLAKGIQGAWNTIIKPAFDGLATAFKIIWGAVSSVASSFGIALNNMGTDKWDAFGKAVGFVGTILVTAKIAESITAISKALALLSFGSIIEGLGSMGKLFTPFTKMGEGLKALNFASIGTKLAPVGEAFLMVLALPQKFIRSLGRIPLAVETFMGRLPAIMGGIFKSLDKLFTGMGEVVFEVFFTKIPGAFKAIGPAITGFLGNATKLLTLTNIATVVRTAITFMFGPWGIVVALVVMGVALLISHWNEVKNWVQQHFGGTIPNIMKTLHNTWNTIWFAIMNTLQKVWQYIEPTIIGGIQRVSTWWKQHWDEIKQVFDVVWKVMLAILSPAIAYFGVIIVAGLGFIQGAWHNIWNMIVDVLKFVWDDITTIIKVAWDVISGIFAVVLDVLTGHWKQAWDDIKSTFVNIWNDIKSGFGNMLSDALDFGKNLVLGIANGITGAVGAVVNAVKGVWSAITGGLSGGASSAGSSVGSSMAHAISLQAHAVGGIFNTPHLGLVAEDGPEAIIPLSKPSLARPLLEQANKMLNVDTGSDIGSSYTPVPTNTSYNTNHTTHADNSMTIQQLTLQLVTQGTTQNPKQLAEQVLEELKRMQVQKDMFTYAR